MQDIISAKIETARGHRAVGQGQLLGSTIGDNTTGSYIALRRKLYCNSILMWGITENYGNIFQIIYDILKILV